MKKKVFVYCRKSSEQEDRQVLSLDSQEKELTKVVSENDLEVLETYKESGSAHVIGRKFFNEMLLRIESGEATGIVVWDESRIARNSLDGGKIIYMMDLEQIVEIYKPGKVYRNTPDDKSWLGMIFMMTKKESDDKGVSARRGMRDKAEQGWYPSPAPLGYSNTPGMKKGTRIIVKDKERFLLVRRLFDEIISGKQASQVYREATEDWKLTSKYGTPIAKSTFYNILNNPFYYGEFAWPKNSDNWYKGKHEPMITKEEFDVVQKMLGKYGKPVSRSHAFDLTGLLRCKECGSSITATKKVKHYKKTGNTATYTYYHCTKKNKDIKCNAKPLTETDLIKQLDRLLSSVKPDIEFIRWAKKWLSAVHDNQSDTQEKILKSQHRALEGTETRLNKLLDMRLNDLLDDSTYKEKKAELEKEKRELTEIVANRGQSLDDWRIKVESTLDFAYACRKRFEDGTRDEKHEIMMRVGSNLLLQPDKKIDITLKREYEALADEENWDKRYENWLEPPEYTDILSKNGDLQPANPLWLPWAHSTRIEEWVREFVFE